MSRTRELRQYSMFSYRPVKSNEGIVTVDRNKDPVIGEGGVFGE